MIRYVGKGKKTRVLDHLAIARKINSDPSIAGKQVLLHRKLAKALRENCRIDLSIFSCFLTDEEAYKIEEELVDDYPKGHLWNLKKGGSGGDRELMLRHWSDPAYREKVTNLQRERSSKKEYRERQRELAIKMWQDPEKRRHHQEQHRRLWGDPITSEERREQHRRLWCDPEKRKMQGEKTKAQWTPERRAAMSANRKAFWADPDRKEKAIQNILVAKGLIN